MRKFLIKTFLITEERNLRLGLTNIGIFTAASVATMVTGTSILSIALWALFTAMMYITFVHFKIWPVKWEELDDEQKIVYGEIVSLGVTRAKLTKEQYNEWLRLLSKQK